MIRIDAGSDRAGGEGHRPSPKLAQAAHSFEASLVQELLKPMQGQDGLSGQDGDGDSDSGSADALRSFGLESVAQAISERGGLGMAKLVLQRLGPLEQRRDQPKEISGL